MRFCRELQDKQKDAQVNFPRVHCIHLHQYFAFVGCEVNHTPGPWQWEINITSKSIHLVGGKPMFDKTVMDFQRWGMGHACPRFNEAIAGNEYNIMTRVSDRPDWTAAFPNREHHRDWCASVVHPDARLIAAAPDLLVALVDLLAVVNVRIDDTRIRTFDAARAAVAKATGVKP